MIKNQTASDSTHPPADHAGASTGGLSRGLFDSPMKTPEPPLVGSMDYYRALAKTNPDIAALVGMIDKQGIQLAKALEALASEHSKRMAAAKILITEAA